MSDLEKNQKLSQEFISKLAEKVLGYLPVPTFEEVINLIELRLNDYYFPFSSESNLLRIIISLYDRATFLNDCLKYPHYIDLLLSIAANSNYLTDIIVRNPEYFYRILNPSNLKEKIVEKSFEKELSRITATFKTFNSKLNALRFIKRREILKIGAKDISGIENLEEITGELSALAKVLCSRLFTICYKEVLTKNQIKKADNKYCIIALGKLGGKELNYSSDVDLIIFYDINTVYPNNKYYNEILTEAIHLFIESSTTLTGEGYIYRIDFRLRPDGRNSPLCGSLNDYLAYYESRGEDWERQMLIKAGYITGDRLLYKEFSESIAHFVYPVNFSSSPVSQISKLKQSIEKNLKDQKNIKLSPGGIRDIEFSVQALQLLNGGKNKELRTGNSLDAVNKLFKADLISSEEKNVLSKAYSFYRKIEHYLQLMNDAQTHTIPNEGEIPEKLSKYLGYNNSLEFLQSVSDIRKLVLQIYHSIMGIDYEVKDNVLNFENINFTNRKQAESDISFLYEGKGLLGQKDFDKNCSELFEKIIPVLNDYLSNSLDPDKVLRNFARVIRSSKFPSIWYREFSDAVFFNSFLKLCEFSQKSIDLFAEDNDLSEYLLTRKAFTQMTIEEMACYSIKKVLFLLVVQFSLKLISSEILSETLSKVIHKKIKEVSGKLFGSKNKLMYFFIASLGSLAAEEMTFSSDIDLIFVVSDLEKNPLAPKIFQNLLSIIKDELNPFEVDCRLRPEGKSSPLVWDLKSYSNYLLSRARTWEFQSLCKLNFIYGDRKKFGIFFESIISRINLFEKEKIKYDIIEMRKKLYPKDISAIANVFNLKRGNGGLADIEFTVQYYLLLNKSLFIECHGKNNAQILEKLNFVERNNIKENYFFLRMILLLNQSCFNVSTSHISFEKNKLDIFSKLLDFKSGNDLQLYFNQIIKENSAFFLKNVI